MTASPRLRPPGRPGDSRAVAELLARAEDSDGVRPLSEQAELALRHVDDLPESPQADGALLLVAADAPEAAGGPELLGVVHLEVGGPDEPPVAELVVAPEARGRGHGATLLTAVRRAAGSQGLRVWAHGDLPAARRLAASAGAKPVRLLHQMRRPLAGLLAAPLPDVPPLPEGVRVRPFRPGADDEAWVALNARAFASHPEQGRWTLDDLRARQAEPWFDPAGFLVAERTSDGSLLGFHWTKVHGSAGEPGALGEVYVVGVDPAARGSGLGRLLVLAGLAHLRDAGLPTALLYVDDDNAAAVRLYRALGFEVAVTDVLWAFR